MKILLPLLLIFSVCYGEILFFDDFSDGDDEGWIHFGNASFDVFNEKYCIFSQAARGLGKSINSDGMGFMSTSDYSVICSIEMECGTESGILARYENSDEWYYRMILQPNNSRILIQRKIDSGATFGIDEYSIQLLYDTVYFVRFQVSGNLIQGKIWQGSIEEEPDYWQLEASDSVQPNPGYFGVFSGGYGKNMVSWSSLFDDITVSTPITQNLSHITWASIKSSGFSQ